MGFQRRGATKVVSKFGGGGAGGESRDSISGISQAQDNLNIWRGRQTKERPPVGYT